MKHLKSNPDAVAIGDPEILVLKCWARQGESLNAIDSEGALRLSLFNVARCYNADPASCLLMCNLCLPRPGRLCSRFTFLDALDPASRHRKSGRRHSNDIVAGKASEARPIAIDENRVTVGQIAATIPERHCPLVHVPVHVHEPIFAGWPPTDDAVALQAYVLGFSHDGHNCHQTGQ